MDLKNVAIVDLKERDQLKEKADKYEELTNHDYLIVQTVSEPVEITDRDGHRYYRNETVSKEIYSAKTNEVVEVLRKEVDKHRENTRQAAQDKIEISRANREEVKKLKNKITTLWVWLIIVSLVATGIMIWI